MQGHDSDASAPPQVRQPRAARVGRYLIFKGLGAVLVTATKSMTVSRTRRKGSNECQDVSLLILVVCKCLEERL